MTQETPTSSEQLDSPVPPSHGAAVPDTSTASSEARAVSSIGDGGEDAPASSMVRAETATDPKRLLLVVGSGRSGTSLLSGVMQRLGFYVPQPEVVADETNPTGFGEPQWVVDFHTSLLERLLVQTTDARPTAWSRTGEAAYDATQRQLLGAWLTEQIEHADRVVVKDPRLLWFVSLWRRVADDIGLEPRFVTMLRHPAEVVASKERWYSALNNAPNRLAGWVNTMLYTERATRECSRAFVVYDDLVSDWTRPIVRLDEQLDLGVVSGVGLSHMQAVARLIDPDLRRSREQWSDLEVSKTLIDLAERVWTDLLALAGDDENGDGRVLARLDTARAEYGRLYGEAEALAWSSIWAARRAQREEPVGRAAAAAKPTGWKTRLRRSLGKLGRATPMGVKRFIPEPIKRPLRRRLK